ncbi:MAG: SRPBCC family protein [Cyclobacteriaceae bacterium]
MKILKYLLIFLAIIAIIFFGKGIITPSVSYESTTSVSKSVEESWAVMTDEETMSKWITGFIKSELVSGEPNTVGAVSNTYVEENGEEMIIVETITDITPNERIAMTFTMDFMDMDYELSMEDQGDQTIITTKSEVRGNGLFAKSIISFMPDMMKAQEDENLAKLKRLIESNTKDYFPEPALELMDEDED